MHKKLSDAENAHRGLLSSTSRRVKHSLSRVSHLFVAGAVVRSRCTRTRKENWWCN